MSKENSEAVEIAVEEAVEVVEKANLKPMWKQYGEDAGIIALVLAAGYGLFEAGKHIVEHHKAKKAAKEALQAETEAANDNEEESND